jgi:hypothetical protein
MLKYLIQALFILSFALPGKISASDHPPAKEISLQFSTGTAAYIVMAPKTALERRISVRLSDYLTKVLGQQAKMIAQLNEVPSGAPVIILSSKLVSPKKAASPESYQIETRMIDAHPAVVASGNTELGLKHAVQRLILESEQRKPGLVIPALKVEESPWIPNREWTLCPWAPDLVRGVFSNPNADKRLNIWLYSDDQIINYVNMFDSFGFSGCQLMETVAGYSILGSAEAAQDRQLKLAKAIRANAQQVTLWVWAAQFTDFGWVDPEITYTPQKGNTAFNDPKVRAGFEKYYNGYAKMAPYVDRLITHFYDPGSLKNRADVFDYMRLLQSKFKAKNTNVELGVDFWASDSDSAYMKQLIDHKFKDVLLLESSMPHLYPAGKREALHKEANKNNMKIGVWGWHTAEIETDQNPMMHINAKLLSHFYRQVRDGADKIQPIHYWSEMEAYHLNNIFTMYAAGQLLWNPDRNPDEILKEISEGIWGPKNGPEILKALQLIQDVRSGPTWDTYWIWSKQHRLGTDDPQQDQDRASEAIRQFEMMKTDPSFVPKFPLPFPPATFVELMLPHLRQIRQFAQSRIDVEAIRKEALNGGSKEKLTSMLTAAWNPVREYNNWIGMFGPLEAAKQEKMFEELARELDIDAKPPGWLRWRDANRQLQVLESRQRSLATSYTFKSDASILWASFNWTKEKGLDRFQLLLDNGCIEKAENGTFRLANWEEFNKK